jgi:hypothetical protein
MICMNWLGKDWDVDINLIDVMEIFSENFSKEKFNNQSKLWTVEYSEFYR